jgi:hypothetical protein
MLTLKQKDPSKTQKAMKHCGIAFTKLKTFTQSTQMFHLLGGKKWDWTSPHCKEIKICNYEHIHPCSGDIPTLAGIKRSGNTVRHNMPVRIQN